MSRAGYAQIAVLRYDGKCCVLYACALVPHYLVGMVVAGADHVL